MNQKRVLWVIIGVATVLAGATVMLVAPSTPKVSAAGGSSPAANDSPARITLHASGRHPELRFMDAADLPENVDALSAASSGKVRPTALAEADLNRDGYLDLIATYETDQGSEMRVRFGSSSGELSLPHSYWFDATETRKIAFGDFNLDGYLDAITANGDTGTVSMMAGTREGGFTKGPTLRLDGDIESARVCDVNRDGLDDLVLLDRRNNRVLVVLGQGDLATAEAISVTVDGIGSVDDLELADFNNDYYLDLVVAGDSGVLVLYGDGRGNFARQRKLEHTGAVTGLVVADISGDHFPDIVISSDGAVTVWNTRLDKGFSRPKRFPAGEGARSLVSGYFNSDGFIDLAVTNDGDQVSILLNRGGRKFSEPMAMQVDGEPLRIAVGEFGPYAKGGIAITKADGRTIVAQVAAAPTVNVSTLLDENDCPGCTIAQLNALTTPNGAPGGGTGISLREAIAAINNDFVINGTTDQGIGFSGLNPAAIPPLLADTPTPTSTLTGPPLNCTDRGVTYWRIGPGVGGAPLPPILAPGTLIDGSNATGVTNTFGPKVFIASWGNGIVITSSAPGSVVKNIGLVGMNGNPGGTPAPANGITVAANNVKILDNSIGVQYDGICIEANTGAGLLLSGTSNTEVKNNLIAGNGIQATTIGDEIQINGISLSIPTPQNNLVESNNIGVNKDNTGPLINPGNGVTVQNGATGNTIKNNVIGRNAINGVNIKDNITSNTTVQGNKVGTDASGQFPAPNGTTGGDGVAVSTAGNSKFNTVTQNLISGNLGNGLSFSSSDVAAQSNVATANKIGVNSTGSVQLPNGLAGVLFTGSANGNTLGGAQLANGNQISGNTQHGVRIGGTIGATNPNNNMIQNNSIGPNSQGTGAPFDPVTPADPLPKSNKGGGVLVDGAAFANTLLLNIIAFNKDNADGSPPVSGITHTSTGNFNKFTQNNIFLNPPDTDPVTPQILETVGNENMRNTWVNNTLVTSLIKIDSAVTVQANGQTTLKGTVNFLDNGVLGNINNAKIEIFVSKRGNEDPTPPSTVAQQRGEAQQFLNSVISLQPNSQNPNTLDWSASLIIPAPFLQTPTVFVTATVTTGDGSTSPFSIGKVPQFVSGGGGGGCTLNVSPGSVTFVNAPIGQPTNRVVTLENAGTLPITISAVTLTPGAPFAKDHPPLPFTLNPGQSQNITIGFTPTNSTPVSGNLAIENNCTGTINVPLSGTGSASKIGVVPTTLDFGTVPTGQTASRTVTIINFGSVGLNITSLTINQAAGSGFSLPNPGTFTVAAQTSSSLTVNFSPATSGSKTGTLAIGSNDPTTPTVNVALTGSGGDGTPPTVVIQSPRAGDGIASGLQFEVRFVTADTVAPSLSTLSSFTASLSTNGGASFDFSLGGGTPLEGLNVLTATAPPVETASAFVRVQVRDAAGNVGSAQNGPFTIGTPPVIINGVIARGKFKTAAAGSNIQAGAVLLAAGQSFALELNPFGTKWVVAKTTLSSPGGLRLRDVAPVGVAISVRIRNPSGILSAPVTIVPQ